MSSTDSSHILLLNVILGQFTRYYSIIVLLFGSIGNLANITVLSHSSMRSNSCVRLLFLASLANLFSIWSGIIPRMLLGWNIDLMNTIGWICKTRTFIFLTCQNIGLWLIVLASVDQWLSSSRNISWRRKSSLKNANIGATIIVTLMILFYSSIFYCYDANMMNEPFPCYSISGFCRAYNDIMYTILILAPLIVMVVFSSMTYFNIRSTQRRVSQMNLTTITSKLPSIVMQQRQKPKVDFQIRMMLFGQSALMIMFVLPFAVYRLYQTFDLVIEKSEKTKAIENFIFNILALSTFITQGISFYIYLCCGGAVFRNALNKSILAITRCIFR